MELTDIAPLEIWRELEQRINERSGLNASVFNVDAIRITDFVKLGQQSLPGNQGNRKRAKLHLFGRAPEPCSPGCQNP
jgi:hypothetical protein